MTTSEYIDSLKHDISIMNKFIDYQEESLAKAKEERELYLKTLSINEKKLIKELQQHE